jgi:hypothetical protein
MSSILFSTDKDYLSTLTEEPESEDEEPEIEDSNLHQ